MTKRLPFLPGFSLCAALLLVACGGAGNTNTATNSGAGNTAATPAAAGTASTTTASAGDKVGVPECDDFIAKYESCVNSKVPESMRSTVRAQLDAMRTSWRQAAATPQGKAGLAQGCKTAHEQAKTSLGAYGCAW